MGILRYSSFCLLLLILLIPNAFGNGFVYDGLGVKARGMGGAFRAIADDWSAAYYNPAGYNRIADNGLGLNWHFYHNRYTAVPSFYNDNGDPTGYYNDQEIYNHHRVLDAPHGGMIFRLPVMGETVFGLSVMQTFAQTVTWTLYDNLTGYNEAAYPRRQFHNGLEVVEFQLTMAKGFMEDKLSVGLNLSLLRGDVVHYGVVLNDNPFTGNPDPLLAQIGARPYDKIPEWYGHDGFGWGFGFRLGFLYEVNEKIDVGLVYNSKGSMDVSGDVNFRYYIPDNPTLAARPEIFDTTEAHYFLEGGVEEVSAEFETTFESPASIAGGISYDVNDKLTIALDAEYIFWSQYEGFEFTYSNFSGLPRESFTTARTLMTKDLNIPVEMEDAGRVMGGLSYQMYDFVQLRAGFGVDQTAISAESYTPMFLDIGTRYNYSIGAGFDIGFWRLEIAGSYMAYDDLSVAIKHDIDNSGTIDNLVGDYSGDVYNVILGLSYRF